VRTQLEGRNVVLEALERGRKVFEIYIDIGARGEKVDKIYTISKRLNIRIERKDRKFLDKITKTDSHQGVIAISETLQEEKLKEVLAKAKNPLVLILKDTVYEHNLGAILRTSAASGVSAIVVGQTNRQALTPIVERVSMGASNIIPVIGASIQSTLSVLKKEGYRIVGVELTGDINYFDADLTGPTVLVLGSEDEGLSLPIVAKCDIVVRVPMMNNVQSLNQSVATALVLFEKVRQEKLIERKNDK